MYFGLEWSSPGLNFGITGELCHHLRYLESFRVKFRSAEAVFGLSNRGFCRKTAATWRTLRTMTRSLCRNTSNWNITMLLYCTQVDFPDVCTSLEYFIFLANFYSYPLQTHARSTPYIFKTGMLYLRGIIEYFQNRIYLYCTPPSQHHETDFNLLKPPERETRMGRKGMLSHICRDPAAIWSDFLIFSFLYLALFYTVRCFVLCQHVSIWHPGNETQQSTIVLVHF